MYPCGASHSTHRLNGRQTEVLNLLCKGLRNREIARQLSLSTRTIKWYVSQLFLVFDVTNRTELVGLVSQEFRAAPRTISADSQSRNCPH